MPFDAFISYSSKDKPTADAACAALEAAGVRCWIAPRDIRAGREYAAGIISGIDACRIMIVIFSTNANASVQIHREIERAVSKGLTIVPLRIEETVPTEAMEFYLGSIHWLDALTPPMERHLQKLADTVKAILQIDASQRAASAGGAPAKAVATVIGKSSELPPEKPGGASSATVAQAKRAWPPLMMPALVLAGVLALAAAGGLWLYQARNPAVTVTPPPSRPAPTTNSAAPAPPKPAESSPLYQDVRTILQAQSLDANGGITIEAAIIHIINCNQPGNREFWIYEYINRPGFRAVLPPNWGASIGGGDYTTLGAAAAAACRS
jgi:hypothetical protein